MRLLFFVMLITAAAAQTTAAASGCEDSEACKEWAMIVFFTSLLVFVCTALYIWRLDEKDAKIYYYATLLLCLGCTVSMGYMASNCLQNEKDKWFTGLVGFFFGGSALILLTEGTFRVSAYRTSKRIEQAEKTKLTTRASDLGRRV